MKSVLNYEVSVISETTDAMADRSSVAKNAAQVTRHKAGTIRKVKTERSAPAPSARQAMEAHAEAQAETPTKISDLPVRSHLEKGISELQGLHEVLLSDDLDPRVLADFRDALNRVRSTIPLTGA
jgi:CxxC motif-containing protein